MTTLDIISSFTKEVLIYFKSFIKFLQHNNTRHWRKSRFLLWFKYIIHLKAIAQKPYHISKLIFLFSTYTRIINFVCFNNVKKRFIILQWGKLIRKQVVYKVLKTTSWYKKIINIVRGKAITLGEIEQVRILSSIDFVSDRLMCRVPTYQAKWFVNRHSSFTNI